MENSKKIAKKIQKIKKHHLASFQGKKGRERPRKKENKNYRSNEFLPDPKQRIQKKIQKNKKHYYGFFSSQNKLGKAEKERK